VGDSIRDLVLSELASMPGLLVVAEELRPEHRLREDLGMESVTLIELVVAIEDAFGFRVDPMTMDLDSAFHTVESLVSFVKEHTA
jgi:acyl carrier protein